MDAEMTDAQLSMIYRLLDQKRVSVRLAAKIIELLLEEVDVNNPGLDNKNTWSDG